MPPSRVRIPPSPLGPLRGAPVRRGGRAVECGGLENRYGSLGSSRVQIPPSPLQDASRKPTNYPFTVGRVCPWLRPRTDREWMYGVRHRPARKQRDPTRLGERGWYVRDGGRRPHAIARRDRGRRQRRSVARRTATGRASPNVGIAARSDHGPISPELALIDPDSGAQRGSRCRIHIDPSGRLEHLPGLSAEARVLSRFRPAPARSPNPHLGAAVDSVCSRRPSAIIALGVLLTLVVGREGQPARSAEQTQSVAAAVAPRIATVHPADTPRDQRPPSQSAPRRARRPHRPMRPRFQGRRSFGSLRRTLGHTSSSCFRAASAFSDARVDEARLELPGRWRQAGRPHALLPGSYRWYVWTIVEEHEASSRTSLR